MGSIKMHQAILVRRNVTAPSRPSSLAAVLFVVACAVAAAAALAGSSESDPEARWRSVLLDRREKMIDRLHDYRTREDFVRNPDPAGGRGHFILDGRGKPCPLASVIIDSGRRDLVEEAARTNNSVKVADLTDGPILAWILRSGLTQEECVMIQRPGLSGERARPLGDEERRQLAAELKRVEKTLRMKTDESITLSVRRMMAAQRTKNAVGARS
jgi:hypothetical protein